MLLIASARPTVELQSRSLVHFSASKHQAIGQSLAENMDLTPSPLTLQFAWHARQ